MSLCKVNGLFRLTRDAEIINTQGGSTITKFGLACSEKFKDKETQLFLDAVAFGKTGEIISQYAGAKGTQIFLSGKLQTDSWEKDGVKHYKTSMVIESFDFVSNKGEAQQPQQNSQTNYTAYREPQRQMPDKNSLLEIDIDEDSIPF